MKMYPHQERAMKMAMSRQAAYPLGSPIGATTLGPMINLAVSSAVTPPPMTIARRIDRGKVQSRGTPRTDSSAESQA